MNEAISTNVSFLAGKVSMLYTHKGVSKPSPLPDFFYWTHASHAKYKLITRNKHRFFELLPNIANDWTHNYVF